MDANEPSPLDPPNNLFRIRLACVLLETCGKYTKKYVDYTIMHDIHFKIIFFSRNIFQ